MLYPNIWAEMERNRLTVKELAAHPGLSDQAVGRKLNGQGEFTLAEIESIAELFHCSLDYLVGHQVCENRAESYPKAVEGQSSQGPGATNLPTGRMSRQA